MNIGELTLEKMAAPTRSDSSLFFPKKTDWDEGFHVAPHDTDWDTYKEIHAPWVDDEENHDFEMFPPEAFCRVLDIRFRYFDGADIFHVEFCMN